MSCSFDISENLASIVSGLKIYPGSILDGCSPGTGEIGGIWAGIAPPNTPPSRLARNVYS